MVLLRGVIGMRLMRDVRDGRWRWSIGGGIVDWK